MSFQTGFDVEYSKSIINQAKAYGVEVNNLESDEDYQSAAFDLYTKAVEAWDNGIKGEHVETIKNMGDNYVAPYESPPIEGFVKAVAENTSHNAPISPKDDPFTKEKIPDAPYSNILDKSNRDTASYKEAVEDRIAENLPVPHEIEGDPPNFPLELGNLSDAEIMRLHGSFAACSSRAHWLFALEDAGATAARTIANKKTSDYIVSAEKKDEETNKAKTMEVLKAEARHNDKSIGDWRDLQENHENKARKFKDAYEIFDNNVERLSRQWTMRNTERQ